MKESGATEFNREGRLKCFYGLLACIAAMFLWSLLIKRSLDASSVDKLGLAIGVLFLAWSIYFFIVLIKVVITGRDFEFMNRY